MIADTSVWIEYLRGTGSVAHRRLERDVASDVEIVVPELVQMELLCGPTDDADVHRIQRLLARFDVVAIAPLVDVYEAAAIQRRCRRTGRSVGSMIDCLIAATALRLDVPVLHRDDDYELIARHSGLRTISLLDG